MLGAGYVQMTTFNEAVRKGMQAGIVIAPQYAITDQLAISSALRYLKSIEVDRSAVMVDQQDLSIGVRYTFL